MEIGGFHFQIGIYGIISDAKPNKKTKMDFRKRVVILNRLGQGATGIVFKALDLIDMKLVAIKVIAISDR